MGEIISVNNFILKLSNWSLKIIIVIEKYGGFCNRLFQSLHYHAFSIEKKIKFFNPSMLGILKYDNHIFYFVDNISNFFLKCISKSIKLIFGKDEVCFYLNKNNYIKFVKRWDYRKYKLTKKHYEILRHYYSFDKKNLSAKSKNFKYLIDNKKIEGKFIVGIHIRRGDYKKWNKGKYYFDDVFYKYLIENLKNILINDNKDPFFIVVSNEKINSEIGMDLFSGGSWREDQIILQSCELIVGPPSTFTMWASYISKVPLIEINSKENKINLNGNVCEG